MARFLIVDDHPLFREALQSVIRRDFPEAEIVEAGSVDAALKLVGSGLSIDLALLDLSMPDVHGFDGLTVAGWAVWTLLARNLLLVALFLYLLRELTAHRNPVSATSRV